MKTFMTATRLFIAVLLLGSTSASTARAQTPTPAATHDAPTPAPGFETHDGLYVRTHLGVGYARMSTTANGSNVVVSGVGLAYGVAVGATIKPNLAVYGTMTGVVIGDPSVEVGGLSFPSDGTAGTIGLGAGASYYLEPANVYVSGSLLANQLEVSDGKGKTIGKTKWGLGVEGLVGKEWWMSDNWGLGVAGQVLWATMKDQAENGLTGTAAPTWTSMSFSLLLSATYN
jgi:hypothetical protein